MVASNEMETFTCKDCGKTDTILNRQIIIHMVPGKADYNVCNTCHGDVYLFSNSIGGYGDFIPLECESCGSSYEREHMKNSNGKIICRKCLQLKINLIG